MLLAYKQLVELQQEKERLAEGFEEIPVEVLKEKHSRLRQLYYNLMSRYRAARGTLSEKEVRGMEEKIQGDLNGRVKLWESILLEHISLTTGIESESRILTNRRRRSSNASQRSLETAHSVWETLLLGYQSAKESVEEYLDYLDSKIGHLDPARVRRDPDDVEVEQGVLRRKYGQLLEALRAIRGSMATAEAEEKEAWVEREIDPRVADWQRKLDQWAEPEEQEREHERSDRGSRGRESDEDEPPLEDEEERQVAEAVLAGASLQETEAAVADISGQDNVTSFMNVFFSSARNGRPREFRTGGGAGGYGGRAYHPKVKLRGGERPGRWSGPTRYSCLDGQNT